MRKAAALLALLLAFAGFAERASAALTGVQVVRAETPATSAGKSATAYCPAGKRVIGAGGDVVPGVVGTPSVARHAHVDAIRPGAQLGAVTARAREDRTGTGETWRAVAFAICAPAPAGLQLVTVAGAESSAAKSAAAVCPAGKRLLGTGGEVTGPPGQLLLDGILPDLVLTRTTANAIEDQAGTADSWTVTAHAICANPIASLERVTATAPPASGEANSATAACPAGKAMSGLGGTINSASGQVLLDGLAPGTEPATATISAVEDETGNPGDWGLTAYAICAGASQRLSNTGVRGIHVSQSLPVTCPEGTRTTGFGGQVTGAFGGVWLRWLRSQNLLAADTYASRDYYEDSTQDPRGWSLTTHAICTTQMAGAVPVTAAGELAAEDSQTVTVTCPSGTRVIGAGGQATDSADAAETKQRILQAVRPDPGLTSVTVTAHVWRGLVIPGGWRPRAWAVCAPPPPGLQRVAASSAVSSDELAVATATCPAGKHLLGTGAEIVNGREWAGFDDIEPDADLTRVRVIAAQNRGMGATGWYTTAYAICANG